VEKPSQLNDSSALATIEGDRQPKQRYRLYSATANDVPFRLKEGEHMPHFKSDDQPQNQPQDVWDGHTQVFDFSKSEDVTAYNVIIDMVAKGRALISKEEVNWDPRSSSYKAFLRWIEMFVEKPKLVE